MGSHGYTNHSYGQAPIPAVNSKHKTKSVVCLEVFLFCNTLGIFSYPKGFLIIYHGFWCCVFRDFSVCHCACLYVYLYFSFGFVFLLACFVLLSLVCCLFFYLDAYFFLMREHKRGCEFQWVEKWGRFWRSWGRGTIIRIFCIKIHFQ